MNEMHQLIAIDVGNTRTRIGRFEGEELYDAESVENGQLATIVERVTGWRDGLPEGGRIVPLIASVSDDTARRIASALADQLGLDVMHVGVEVPIPIGRRLDPETLTGSDRLLNAAAAYDVVQQACVVVDAGTAVTVDFVDGEGTFHGGAITPGGPMQLRSLHRDTAALPELDFVSPDPEAFGRSTAQAMLHGVYHGIRGMVRHLVEQYAVAYGAYPMVIATGGDAAMLFEGEELIDRIVPDLTLRGIAVCARHALRADDRDADVRP